MLSIFYIVILSILFPLLGYILFIFIKNFKKNKGLYKSVIGQVFQGKFSFSLIVVFYGVTFGLSGGLLVYIQKLGESLQRTLVDSNASTNYSNDLELNFESEYWNEGTYKNYLGLDKFYSNSEDGFILSLNDQFDNDSPSYNWWEDVGELYFGSTQNVAKYLLVDTYFSVVEKENESIKISYSYEQQFELVPNIQTTINEQYYFLGQNNYDPFLDTRNKEFQEENTVFKSNNGKNILNQLIVYSGNIEDISTEVSGIEPIPVGVQKDWAWNKGHKVGSIITINNSRFEIVAIVDIPNWLYSVHSLRNLVADMNQQAVMIIDNQNLMMINDDDDEKQFVMNYAYSDVHDNNLNYKDYTYGGKASNTISERRLETQIYFDNLAEDSFLFSSGTHSSINQLDSLDDMRQSVVLISIDSNTIFMIVLFTIFVVIITFVMTLLIKKRVKNNSKQLGTLKALGQTSSEISAAYILFPIVLITLGGIAAIIATGIIQWWFIILGTKFLSISIPSWFVTTQSILLVLVLPLLIFTVLGFFLSRRILKKPTLDLLTNKVKETPNKAVRAIGYLTPSFVSFKTSYKVKGLLRAFGKSTLLFFALFGGATLTSLSMSMATMMNTINSETLALLNFNQMTEINPNGYANTTNSKHYEEQEAITFGILTEAPNEEGYYLVDEDFIDGFSNILSSNLLNPDEALDYLKNSISTDEFDNIISSENGTYKVNKYVPQEFVITYTAMYTAMQVQYGFLPIIGEENRKKINEFILFDEEDITILNFYTWQIKSLFDTFNAYITHGAGTLEYLQDLVKNKDIVKIIEEVKPYKKDLVFLDIYTDKEKTWYQQSTNLYKDENLESANAIKLDVWNDLEEDANGEINFPFKIDQESLRKLENYEGENIPIIVHKQYESWFNDNYPNSVKSIYSDYYEIDPITGSLEKKTEIFKFEIIGVYDTLIPFGAALTTNEDYIEYIESNKISENARANYEIKFQKDYPEIGYSTSKISDEKLATFIASGNKNLSLTEFIDQSFVNEDRRVSLTVESADIPLEFLTSQSQAIYDVMSGWFLVISILAIFVAFGLVTIAIKEVVDSSKREVAMLKVFGYSNKTATSLVLTPYIVIALLSFIIAIPLALGILGILGSYLTLLTGTTFIFKLSIIQWTILSGLISGLIFVLVVLSYVGFRNTKALQALQETEE